MPIHRERVVMAVGFGLAAGSLCWPAVFAFAQADGMFANLRVAVAVTALVAVLGPSLAKVIRWMNTLWVPAMMLGAALAVAGSLPLMIMSTPGPLLAGSVGVFALVSFALAVLGSGIGALTVVSCLLADRVIEGVERARPGRTT